MADRPPRKGDTLRVWLEYVAATAIAMLDELDAAGEDLEDDDAEDDREAA